MRNIKFTALFTPFNWLIIMRITKKICLSFMMFWLLFTILFLQIKILFIWCWCWLFLNDNIFVGLSPHLLIRFHKFYQQIKSKFLHFYHLHSTFLNQNFDSLSLRILLTPTPTPHTHIAIKHTYTIPTHATNIYCTT